MKSGTSDEKSSRPAPRPMTDRLQTMKNSPTDGEYCPIRSGFLQGAEGGGLAADDIFLI
jgi:hypothetical protein